MSVIDRFALEGWLQVDGLFPTDLVEALRDDFARQIDGLVAEQDGARTFLNVGDGRAMLSVKLEGPFLDPQLFANPILMALLGSILGSDFLIDSFTCVVASPGACEQQLHRDYPPLYANRTPPGLPAYAATLVVPLVDLTPHTGTTKLFPRTHLGAEAKEAALPYVKRGSCFLMDYRIQHQGTANLTDSIRPVLYIVNARPWFTDMDNFRRQPRINMAEEALARIPAEHRPLFRRLAAPGAIDKSAKTLFA